MNTIEFRKKVLKSLSNADDTFLKMVDTLYANYNQNEQNDFFNDLPLEIQEILMLSRDQAKLGKTKLHKDIMLTFRKKYNFAG